MVRTVLFPTNNRDHHDTHGNSATTPNDQKNKGTQALKLLESKPLTVDAQAEIRSLAQWIKNELHNEYERMSSERAQRTMSVFELTVYSPTIEETWKRSGISRLKIDGVLDHKWEEPLEAVVYNAGKYLS